MNINELELDDDLIPYAEEFTNKINFKLTNNKINDKSYISSSSFFIYLFIYLFFIKLFLKKNLINLNGSLLRFSEAILKLNLIKFKLNYCI